MGFQDALHTIRHGDQLSKDAYNTVKKWSDKRIPEAEDMLEVRTGAEEQINEHILTPMFCIRGFILGIFKINFNDTIVTFPISCFRFPLLPPNPHQKKRQRRKQRKEEEEEETAAGKEDKSAARREEELRAELRTLRELSQSNEALLQVNRKLKRKVRIGSLTHDVADHQLLDNA